MTDANDKQAAVKGFEPAPIPQNDAARLRELSRLGLTEFDRNDPDLDDIIRIARALTDTPIAMINILDRPDQHTLRSRGLPTTAPTKVLTEDLLCQFVLAHGDVLVIEDMHVDERTRSHPLANPPSSLRFYAGAPLVTSSGYIVGTLCVMAPEQKTPDLRIVDALRRLANQAIGVLERKHRQNADDVGSLSKKRTPSSGRFYPQTSVMFTDIVGFTRHTEALEPAELLSALSHYFSAFDKICDRFGLTPIKTIGDAYMAASGIPVSSAEHARNAVAAGLSIRDYVAAENLARAALGEPAWEVRIGVHSGPAIAGSLGERGIDIWGNTVNVASRLETAGKAGRVNVSEATLTLLGKAEIEERGDLPMKNKAPLRMYFINQLH